MKRSVITATFHLAEITAPQRSSAMVMRPYHRRLLAALESLRHDPRFGP
jgi:hypothetical protein